MLTTLIENMGTSCNWGEKTFYMNVKVKIISQFHSGEIIKIEYI